VKIRIGFVSNSSSQSFLIEKRFLSPVQIDMIINHSNCGEEYAASDAWSIDDGETIIQGSTIINNFCMENYLHKIGVKDYQIIWGD
jgi:hypothetical protein